MKLFKVTCITLPFQQIKSLPGCTEGDLVGAEIIHDAERIFSCRDGSLPDNEASGIFTGLEAFEVMAVLNRQADGRKITSLPPLDSKNRPVFVDGPASLTHRRSIAEQLSWQQGRPRWTDHHDDRLRSSRQLKLQSPGRLFFCDRVNLVAAQAGVARGRHDEPLRPNECSPPQIAADRVLQQDAVGDLLLYPDDRPPLPRLFRGVRRNQPCREPATAGHDGGSELKKNRGEPRVLLHLITPVRDAKGIQHQSGS